MFVAIGPTHSFYDESWSANTSKTFTPISSIEARGDLEQLLPFQQSAAGYLIFLPIAMQSQQQKACKNCPCDDYST